MRVQYRKAVHEPSQFWKATAARWNTARSDCGNWLKTTKRTTESHRNSVAMQPGVFAETDFATGPEYLPKLRVLPISALPETSRGFTGSTPKMFSRGILAASDGNR